MEFDRLASVALLAIGLGVIVVAAQHEGFKFFSSGQSSQASSSECKRFHQAVRTMRAKSSDDIDRGGDKLSNLARNCKAETIHELKTAHYLIVWGISRNMGTIQFQNPHEAAYAKAFIARYPNWKQQHPESVLREAAFHFGFK